MRVLCLWAGQMGMLKKAERRSTLLNLMAPWILEVKSRNNGRGWASVIVFWFNRRKSVQHLTPPPGLSARWSAELQSVLVLGLTFSIIPSLIILSQASFPFWAFSESCNIGLLLLLQGL